MSITNKVLGDQRAGDMVPLGVATRLVRADDADYLTYDESIKVIENTDPRRVRYENIQLEFKSSE